ncbi:MAG: DUF4190 domain-containing protein [Clostridiales bacterium]|nr:DUF4190 domain-containing protein [Clostridiales bacterium]
MFCSYCGKKVADTDKFCKECGAEIKKTAEVVDPVAETENTQVESNEVQTKKFSGKAIAGFVLSLAGIVFAGMICGIIGLILSSIALKNIKNNENLRGKGLAIAGLVISIIDIVIMIIYYGMF